MGEFSIGLYNLEAAKGKRCKVAYILEGFPNEEETGMLREVEFNDQTNSTRIVVEVKGVCIFIETDRIVSLAVSA